ncbi:DUF222 domain-containing protein [Nocardia sp. NPDC046763]|uniref:HNH endonuclease signature motif containing protein n=1 Tax=Nocardia sp. NPDC046763 TaxID=3155256 RepID=UPI00340EBB05
MNSKGEVLEDCGVAELATAVQTLSNASLKEFSDGDIVELMQRLETCKRQLSALDSRLIIEACDRSLPKGSAAKDVVPFLRQTLGLSKNDASLRVKIALQCGEFFEPTGHLRPATLAKTAEAYEAGDISRDHVRNIIDVMTHLPTDIPAETRTEAEDILVGHSRVGWPDDLPKIGRDILARVDPDGKVVSDADRRRRRGLILGRPGVDGMSWIEGWITPELRALLDAVFAKLARPGMCNIDDVDSIAATAKAVDSKVLDAAARRDRRDAGQRTHDALYALLQPGVDPAKLGSHRGLPVQAIVTMSLNDLERGAGVATTASGGHVSINEALKMAEGTKPVLVVLDSDGMPLYLGRCDRLASPAQRLALIARDKGCTRPGCETPASMCAVHHITDWAKGGPTDLNNLTLACDHCHALVNDSAGAGKLLSWAKIPPIGGAPDGLPRKVLTPQAPHA